MLKYRPEMCDDVRKLCFVGATHEMLAEWLGICVDQLLHWRNKYPEFAAAMQERERADNRVIGKLYARAIGMTVVEEIEEMRPTATDEATGEPVKEMVLTRRVTKEVPPDTTAAIFWLKNRRREQWRDRHDIEVVDGDSVVEMLNAGRDRVAALKAASDKSKIK